MAQTYTIHQLAKAADVSRTQLEQWITRGHFKPKNEELTTKARSFTFADAMRLSVLAELVRFGLTPATAARHSDGLYGYKDDPALLVLIRGPQEITISGKKMVFHDPDSEALQSKIIRLRDLTKLAQNPLAYVTAFINLDEVEKRVAGNLEKIIKGETSPKG